MFPCQTCKKERSGCSKCYVRHGKFCAIHKPDWFRSVSANTYYCLRCFAAHSCPTCKENVIEKCRFCYHDLPTCSSCALSMLDNQNTPHSCCRSCYEKNTCVCGEHRKLEQCSQCHISKCTHCRPMERVDISPLTLAQLFGSDDEIVPLIARYINVCCDCMGDKQHLYFQQKAL